MKSNFFMPFLLILFFIINCRGSLRQFDNLMEPRIIEIPMQKMLIAETRGNPDNMKNAVGELYNAYFKLKFKSRKMVSPRARWPKPYNTPIDEWIGLW